MKNFQNEWSRRQFMATVTGASAALVMPPFSAWATDELDPKILALVAKTFSIDTHNHVDVPSKMVELVITKVDLLGEMKKSGLSAICMTFAVDRPQLTEAGQAYERFVNGLDAMDAYLKSNNMTRALTVKDLKKANKKQKPIVVQSCEGGHFLEGKLERLEIAYKRGLRILGLLHDAQASVPIGDIYTDPPKYNGLTEFGVNVIKECNRLGILIDLTHCSNDAINGAINGMVQKIKIRVLPYPLFWLLIYKTKAIKLILGCRGKFRTVAITTSMNCLYGLIAFVNTRSFGFSRTRLNAFRR